EEHLARAGALHAVQQVLRHRLRTAVGPVGGGLEADRHQLLAAGKRRQPGGPSGSRNETDDLRAPCAVRLLPACHCPLPVLTIRAAGARLPGPKCRRGDRAPRRQARRPTRVAAVALAPAASRSARAKARITGAGSRSPRRVKRHNGGSATCGATDTRLTPPRATSSRACSSRTAQSSEGSMR